MQNINPNEIMQQAWKKWFQEDYSWEGLSKKNLQDYWRKDPSTKRIRSDAELIACKELILCNGQKSYHIAHLPIAYEDGTLTVKNTPVVKEQVKRLIETHNYNACNEYKALNENEKIFNGHETLANFSGIVVVDLDLSNREINAAFNNSIFIGTTSFWRAAFLSRASFEYSAFAETANFTKAHFEDACIFQLSKFLGVTNFSGATIKGDAIFWDTIFLENLNFIGVKFLGNADFQRAKFNGHTNFTGAVCNYQAYFHSVIFESRIIFFNAKFLADTYFNEVTFPTDAKLSVDTFFETNFNAPVSFRGLKKFVFSAFNCARFYSSVIFDYEMDELQTENFFYSELKDIQNGKDDREKNLAALEGGCRKLKQEMANISDKNREYLYYKLEISARRNRKSIKLEEKIASSIYKIISDYGMSIKKPFWGMLITWLFFAVVYLVFIDGFKLDLSPQNMFNYDYWDSYFKMLAISGNRILPLGAFENESQTFANTLSGNHLSSFEILAFRILATFESVAAIILLFLFGLALKRKFQLN